MGLNWVGPALMRFGTDAQQERFLPASPLGSCSGRSSSASPAPAPIWLRSDHRGARWRTVHRQRIEDLDRATPASPSHGFLLCRSQPGSRRRDGLSVLLVEMQAPKASTSADPDAARAPQVPRGLLRRRRTCPDVALLGPSARGVGGGDDGALVRTIGIGALRPHDPRRWASSSGSRRSPTGWSRSRSPAPRVQGHAPRELDELQPGRHQGTRRGAVLAKLDGPGQQLPLRERGGVAGRRISVRWRSRPSTTSAPWSTARSKRSIRGRPDGQGHGRHLRDPDGHRRPRGFGLERSR